MGEYEEEYVPLFSEKHPCTDTNTIKVQIGAGQNFDYGDIVSMGSDGKAYNMSDVLGVAVEGTQKKKRRKNMFKKMSKLDNKINKEMFAATKATHEYLETELKKMKEETEKLISSHEHGYKHERREWSSLGYFGSMNPSLLDRMCVTPFTTAPTVESDSAKDNIKQLKSELTDLKADVHELCYPIGEIKEGYIGSGDIKGWVKNYYTYASKDYFIPEIANNNITGYRKQGDYIQIRWVEEVEMKDGSVTMGKQIRNYSKTFLLKDELIPLEGCTVEFKCDFMEVGDE